MKDPIILLKHILDSIANIESFSNGLSQAGFKKDKLRQSAIIRQIEIIGEAAKNVPTDFSSKHPEIKWNEIAGSRDKLIHHYFGVDLDIVWEIIEKDIPRLKEKIKHIISSNKTK